MEDKNEIRENDNYSCRNMEAKKHQTAIIGRYTERRGEGSRFEDRIFRT